ncbi:hypothetical protein [Bacillus altitudinis]|uniref:hypothetical protein n=1 Tax=Bacillus altitudinis TaxID=293387 RepID=UPI001643F0E3|nr:hypothetical protein [Bacillus altitudinis]
MSKINSCVTRYTDLNKQPVESIGGLFYFPYGTASLFTCMNSRIRCQSCVLVLINVTFTPRQYASFLDCKGFLSR